MFIHASTVLAPLILCLSVVTCSIHATTNLEVATRNLQVVHLSDDNIYFARDSWIYNKAQAEIKYGRIGDWNTSEVTSFFNLFSGVPSTFNEDLSSWNVEKVTNMYGMFQHMTSFNIDLSSWNVENVRDMTRMFFGASSFNQCLDWDTNGANTKYMFDGSKGTNACPLECGEGVDHSWMWMGKEACSCGSSSYSPYPVDCTAHGDVNSYCVYGDHCACGEGFVCTDGSTNIYGECPKGHVCAKPCESPFGAQSCSCGNPDPFDCTAHGDPNAKCVSGKRCSCGKGFECASIGDPDMLVEGGKCRKGSVCTPVPPKSILSDPIASDGKKSAKKFLKKVTDGKQDTFGTIKMVRPFFSVKVNYVSLSLPYSNLKVAVTITPLPGNKGRRKLKNMQIWSGDDKNKYIDQCGGKLKWKDLRNKNGPITVQCMMGKVNDRISLRILGNKKKNMQIVELSVTEFNKPAT